MPDDLPLDPDLLQAAKAVAAARVERATAQLPRWLADAVALRQGRPTTGMVEYTLSMRVINELAMWQLDSTGPAFDRLWMEAVRSPRFCFEWLGARPFAALLRTLQLLPPHQRTAALEAQDSLLARWGQPRLALPARAAPSQMERADTLISRLRAGDRPAGLPPMLPILASRTLGGTVALPDRQLDCLRAQWWMASEASRTGDWPIAWSNARLSGCRARRPC